MTYARTIGAVAVGVVVDCLGSALLRFLSLWLILACLPEDDSYSPSDLFLQSLALGLGSLSTFAGAFVVGKLTGKGWKLAAVWFTLAIRLIGLRRLLESTDVGFLEWLLLGLAALFPLCWLGSNLGSRSLRARKAH